MSERVPIRRDVRLPDPLAVARARRVPELGARILFFTGGTALRRLARALKLYTHNSVHVMTPFDSGGSSAHLRRAFAMPSVGDVRNRLMALADETVRGNPALYDLFARRLPADATPAARRASLDALVEGDDAGLREVPDPMRRIVCRHLRFFVDVAPGSFDLAGASIGNLVLAGGYLNADRDLDSVIFLFSRLVEARGVVRPVVDLDLHLAATLADGTRLVGQHRITGKETAPIASPVAELELVRGLDDDRPAEALVSAKVRQAIGEADLVCFPPGSFWTSLVANLLPAGVGRAVRAAAAPKVWVPNTGRDPEQHGLTVADCLERLLARLRADAGAGTPAAELVQLVLLHTDDGVYAAPVDEDRLEALGARVVRLDLVDPTRPNVLDAERLAQVLVSLA